MALSDAEKAIWKEASAAGYSDAEIAREIRAARGGTAAPTTATPDAAMGDVDIGAGRAERAKANGWSEAEQLKHDVSPDANPTPGQAARGFLGVAGGMAGGELAGKVLTGAVARSAAREPGAVMSAVKDVGRAATDHIPAQAVLDMAAHSAGVPHGVVTALKTAPAAIRAGGIIGDEALGAIGRGVGIKPYMPSGIRMPDTGGVPTAVGELPATVKTTNAYVGPEAEAAIAARVTPPRNTFVPPNEDITAKLAAPAQAQAEAQVSAKMAAYKARLAEQAEAKFAKGMGMSLEKYRAMVARSVGNPSVVHSPPTSASAAKHLLDLGDE